MDRGQGQAERVGAKRRERMHQQVLAEICEAALAELEARGPSGVTMRAVARSIDITPSGLYRYVADHDELLGLLVTRAYDAIHEQLRATCDAVPAGGPAAAWYECALGMREWALTHPSEHELVTSPGVRTPSTARAAARRIVDFMTQLSAEAIDAGQIDLGRAAFPADGVEFRIAHPHPAARSLTLAAIAALTGFISFEMREGFKDVGSDQRDYYAESVIATMRLMGFATDHLASSAASSSTRPP